MFFVSTGLFFFLKKNPISQRETSSSSDDVYLRHRATLNSFPEGLPNSYEVEGLRFNEGCRDHNGQLSGEQYWELSSYCIPAHYDHARHYDAESPSLAGSASHQYGTSFNHYSSEPPTAAATVSQLQCFDGHAGAPLVSVSSLMWRPPLNTNALSPDRMALPTVTCLRTMGVLRCRQPSLRRCSKAI
jgi:hypothetical protein